MGNYKLTNLLFLKFFNKLLPKLFSGLLIFSVILGGVIGHYWRDFALYLKPIGDIFLNLILTLVVPLVFFNVSSAIARTKKAGRLGKVFASMSIIFIVTSFIAACLGLLFLFLFPPAFGDNMLLDASQVINQPDFLGQMVSIFTVSEFSQLFSHKHMLALILFAMAVGWVSTIRFSEFLYTGEQVFTRLFEVLMLAAPIGFLAYFAVLVSEWGPDLIKNYAHISVLYYVLALIYFIVMYTIYAYLAGNRLGVTLFWKNVSLPATTAIATCSSAASIPANIIATQSMRVPDTIVETVIPLGAMTHKEGSVIGGAFKIVFILGLFHIKFSGILSWLVAVAVSMMVGTVMGAIPGGGMLGELFILTVYGLPPSALIILSAISIIIDPIATLLNVTGNSVNAMLIARLVDGKNWLKSWGIGVS